MEKVTKLFDELADKYGISDEDRAKFGKELMSAVNGELKDEGDDFEAPKMGDKDDAAEENESAPYEDD